MTVSNVVNRRFHLMSDATRARVEDAIASLGYRRRADGLSLRGSQRYAVAMVVVDPTPAFLADPFTTYLVAGLTNTLTARGYSLVLARTDLDRLGDAHFVRNRATDAICLMLSGPRAARARCLARVKDLGEPVVVFQERPSRWPEDVCAIRQDDRGAARALAKHVLGRGAQRLLVLVPGRAWPAIEARLRGFRDALREHGGRATLETLACGDEHYPETQAALDAWLRTHGLPDAILAGNDQMGIAALRELEARGVRVPGDVLITGFNAFEFWRYSMPRLLSARSPAYEMGAAAGEALLARLSEGAFPARERVFPVDLVPGDTA
jgi:LacI family transcriptional regulator